MVSGPISNDSQLSKMPSAATTFLLASLEKSSAITKSTGNIKLTPASSAWSINALAIGILSSSNKEFPTE